MKKNSYETFIINITEKGDVYVDGVKYVPEVEGSFMITKE